MSLRPDPNKPNTFLYQRARFATQLPADYLYSPSHFWLAREEAQICRIGLTRFGSRMLGEMAACGFHVGPEAPVVSGQVIGWIEGFKALSDIFCIAEGRFAGANRALEQNPALINQDPYGAGWLYAVRGNPDTTCVEAQGYGQILDRTIDQLARRQAGNAVESPESR